MNFDGTLGDGTTTQRLTPTAVSGLTDAVEIGGGKWHRCARRNGGSLVCWGDNAYGQVGDDTTTDRSVPTPVYDPRADGPLTGIARLGRGGSALGHTCAQRTDGTLLCWGKNNFGALGDGTFLNRTAPKAVSGL
jgi:alpha-tubulin suppressor-like RCC1 family protein